VTLGRLALILSLAACKGGDELVVRPFNNAADSIQIEVAPGDVGDPITVNLTSNTGAVVIGSATVDPGRGPVGTNHLLLVEVADDWEDRIDFVSITSTGARGEEEYQMRQDAADPGFFDLTLTSLGAPDEVRTDTWKIILWEPTETPEVIFEGDTDL